MKNFSELLATELHLDVSINNNTTAVGLYEHLTFNADDQVTVDGIEVLPKYSYLADAGTLSISEPFYRWYHRVSGQGWLLEPQ
jgi:hypothetical protein